MKVLIEPSGVAAAAAVRHKKADFSGRRVGVVLSGGNVDLPRLSAYIAARPPLSFLKSRGAGRRLGYESARGHGPRARRSAS